MITDIAHGEADLDTLKAGASLIPVAKITKVPKVVKAIGNVGKTGLKKGKEGDKTVWKRFTQKDQPKPDKNKGNQSKAGSKGSTTTSKPNQEEASKSGQAKQTKAKNKGGSGTEKRINVGDSGHHVPAVRKSKGRPFEVSRSDKTRPTIFSKGSDPGHDHWRLHDAERNYVDPRQGDFIGTDDELFDAYRNAYKGLDDIKVDIKSPNGTYTLGTDVTPKQAVDLIQNWLKEQGLY